MNLKNMSEIIKNKSGLSLPKYKLVSWVFEDQFWNKVDGVMCSWADCPDCQKLGLKKDFLAYTNYWCLNTRKIYICDSCISHFPANRVNRVKNNLNAKIWSYNKSRNEWIDNRKEEWIVEVFDKML